MFQNTCDDVCFGDLQLAEIEPAGAVSWDKEHGIGWWWIKWELTTDAFYWEVKITNLSPLESSIWKVNSFYFGKGLDQAIPISVKGNKLLSNNFIQPEFSLNLCSSMIFQIRLNSIVLKSKMWFSITTKSDLDLKSKETFLASMS